MPQPLHIRRLGSSDLNPYRRLRQQALQECPSAFGATAAGERQLSDVQLLARFASTPGQAMWGAVTEAGDLCATLGMYRDLGEKLAHKAQLYAMYVAPEARGQGLAKRLLHMAREHAQQLGLRQLLLDCNADNSQALRLYEQAGFRRYGLAPEAIGLDGRFFDEVLMVLPLTAGPR
ncbi:MAG: GNAT family N-acetyltransferase [Comamonas sp.]|nr:GNAT family N-acetyltransferase [Comamonas sp.]